ncbi:MAG: hypothetical protein SPK72_05325 [Bacteroidales bacterium]|jgi:hypothetical protein|nr:hypothetical protein [Bacteroidales bacterium]
MKRSKESVVMIVCALALSAIMVLGFDSCNNKKEDKKQETVVWSPDPVNGDLPESVLPAELKDLVCEHFTIYAGDKPAKVRGQFVSRPHALLATSLDTTYVYGDSVVFFNDRYICFERNSNGSTNFYGKQWYDEYDKYYEEAYYQLKSVGEDDKFTCYYLTEGYPDGMYALQSTIFSGKWNESYGGLKDFQVAVVLLETSGNPNLDPKNSYRVLGDYDGLAKDTAWLGKRVAPTESITITDEDAFRLFRKR